MPIINAAASGKGRAFAMRNANSFTPVLIDPAETVSDISSRVQRRAQGKRVDLRAVCRETPQEAEDYWAITLMNMRTGCRR